RLGNQGLCAQGPAADIAALSEHQDLIDQIAGAFGPSPDRSEIAAEPRVRTEMLLHHLGMTENPTQYIVEIMRNAAGQRTDLLHAPCLLQPSLQSRPFGLHGVSPDRIENGIERHAQQAECGGRRYPAWPSDHFKSKQRRAAILAHTDHPRASAGTPGQ